MTDEQKNKVAEAIRRAVKAKAEMWDAEYDAEQALGGEELNTAELVDSLASALDYPEEALDIEAEDIIPAIERLINLPWWHPNAKETEKP